MQKKFNDDEGSSNLREYYLFTLLRSLGKSESPCDITRYSEAPLLNVYLSEESKTAIRQLKTLDDLLLNIKDITTTSGESVAIDNIWDIHPMTDLSLKGGIIDLSDGNKDMGDGETIRDYIRDSYNCGNVKDEEFFLTRYLLSLIR